MLFPRRAVEINRFSEIPLCTCKRTQVSRTASASISPSEYFSQHFGNLRPIHEGKHNALICIPRAPFSTAWPAVISSCAAAAARGIARAQTVRQSETGGIDAQAMPDTEMMGRILLRTKESPRPYTNIRQTVTANGEKLNLTLQKTR